MNNKKIYVYCHMTDDLEGCRGGGWTLVMKIDGTKVSRLSSFLLVSQMFALEKTSGMWLVHEKSYQTFVQQKVKPFLDLIIMHTTRSNRYLQYNCRSYLPFVPPYHELPRRDHHYFQARHLEPRVKQINYIPHSCRKTFWSIPLVLVLICLWILPSINLISNFPSFSQPSTMIPNVGVTWMTSILKEGRMGLIHKRPSYRPTGTRPSPRSA